MKNDINKIKKNETMNIIECMCIDEINTNTTNQVKGTLAINAPD